MIRAHAASRLAARGAAVVVVGLTLAYAATWMLSARWQPPGDLGLSFDGNTLEIAAIEPGGPADEAGMKPYDRVVDLDGRPVTTQLEIHDALRHAGPGTPVRLTVRLAGLGDRPRSFDLWLGPPPPREPGSRLGAAARGLAWGTPLLLTVLIAAVLFARPERAETWLVAATTAGMIATAPLMPFFHKIPPGLRGFAVFYKVTAWALGPALLFHLLAIFPRPSEIDRRYPWIKTGWPALSLLAALFVGIWLRATGVAGLPYSAAPGRGVALGWLAWIGAAGGGTACVVANLRDARTAEEERPLRVLLAGLASALAAVLSLAAISGLTRTPVTGLAAWLWLPSLGAVLLLPVALAWVATSDEVCDLTVAARRLARYLVTDRVAGSGLALLVGAVVGLLAADAVTALGVGRNGSSVTGGIVALLVGGGGAWCRLRFIERIDAVLFPDAHRTRRILRDLAGEIASAATIEELGSGLELRLEQALVPSSIALYVARGDRLGIARGRVGRDLEEIPLHRPLVPLERKNPDGSPVLAPIGSLDRVARLGPDCLVPLGGARLAGLLVLGRKRTDEPYTRDELRLLGRAGDAIGPVLERLADGPGSLDEAAENQALGAHGEPVGGADELHVP